MAGSSPPLWPETVREPEADGRRHQWQVPGSGTAGVVGGTTVVCSEKLVTVVVPSRFTSTVKANPSVVFAVRTGVVPVASENMLKANVLPEVDVPSGVLKTGP